MKPESRTYSPLPDFDQTSLSDDSRANVVEVTDYNQGALKGFSNRYALHLFVGAVLLFTLSIGFFVAAIVKRPSDRECTLKLSTYSPVIDAVEYEELNFNNHLGHQTVFRGPPTNELEREWEKLWNHDLVRIPEESFSYLNKSSEKMYMRVKPEDGGGYAASIDVFHQIHCLNLIRQYTWRDYYDEHAEIVEKPSDLALDTEDGIRIHVDHCIETLRLNLMCHGDITPYLIEKQYEDDIGIADFNSHHKCRKFNKIVDNFEKNSVIQRWPGGHRQYIRKEYKGLYKDVYKDQ